LLALGLVLKDKGGLAESRLGDPLPTRFLVFAKYAEAYNALGRKGKLDPDLLKK